MIIVSIASHRERINNVCPVLNNIIFGTIVPNKIVINLAKSDFQNTRYTCYSLYELVYETHTFPEDLYNLIKDNNDLIEIHWYDDASIKSWKRYYYVTKYYTKDVIITIDDDRIYSKHFVEYMIKSYEYYNCKYPITTIFDLAEGSFRMGAYALLYTPKMLGFFSDEIFTSDVIHMFPDDIYVSGAFEYFGYLKMPVIGKNFLFENLSYNEKYSMYSNDVYSNKEIMHKVQNDTYKIMSRFNEITNTLDTTYKCGWNFNTYYYGIKNITNYINRSDYKSLKSYEKMIYDTFVDYLENYKGKCVWCERLENELSNIKLN